MEAIVERCCGINVHKSKLTACLLVGKPNGKAEKTMKIFSTMIVLVQSFSDKPMVPK